LISFLVTFWTDRSESVSDVAKMKFRAKARVASVEERDALLAFSQHWAAHSAIASETFRRLDGIDLQDDEIPTRDVDWLVWKR